MTADDRLLRRTFEVAFEVARRRASETPPRELPPALRRFERFAKLPPAALATIRRTLEEDDAFRAEVAAAPEAADLGAPALLWLRRPEGWEARLDEILAEADAATGVGADARLLRRLEGAERAQERERRRAADLEAQLERLREELDARRRADERLEEERAALRSRVEELTAARARAVQELQQVKEILDRRTAQLRAIEDRVAQGIAPPAPVEPAEVAATRARVEELAVLAAGLRDGLARLRAELAPAPVPSVAALHQPAPLPPGVLDETLQAAEHLLTRAGALVLVDGYNVAKLGWPSLELAEQRDALVAALAPVVAVPANEVWVVFDGSDVDAPRPPARRGLQVRFSPDGITADDVILDLVDRLPPTRRVVVVSNDRKVRDGARRSGARVVSADHLLAVARRPGGVTPPS